MFSAEPESPSFVENAMTSRAGVAQMRLRRHCDGAVRYAVGKLGRVLPVHGAIKSASSGFGPSGSASAMVVITLRPVSSMRRRMFTLAAPKRVSVSAAVRS